MYTVCVLLGNLDIIEDSLVGHNIKTLPMVVAVPLKKNYHFPLFPKIKILIFCVTCSPITFVLMFLAHLSIIGPSVRANILG